MNVFSGELFYKKTTLLNNWIALVGFPEWRTGFLDLLDFYTIKYYPLKDATYIGLYIIFSQLTFNIMIFTIVTQTIWWQI